MKLPPPPPHHPSYYNHKVSWVLFLKTQRNTLKFSESCQYGPRCQMSQPLTGHLRICHPCFHTHLHNYSTVDTKTVPISLVFP